jgi:hypothetical protein
LYVSAVEEEETEQKGEDKVAHLQRWRIVMTNWPRRPRLMDLLPS